MALAKRKKFLKDFDKFIKQRSSANITKAKIVLNFDEWEDTIIKSITEGTHPETGGQQVAQAEGLSQKGNPLIQKTWVSLGKELRKWSKKPPRSNQTWRVQQVKLLPGQTRYEIEATGKVGPYGTTRITWSTNIVRSIRDVIKTWARSYYPGTTVVAEHGATTESKSGPLQSQIQFKGVANPTPGQRGTNVHTALIKALKLTAKNFKIDVFGRVFADFLQYKYQTKVDRRKSTNTYQAEHEIELVIIPESDQTGGTDRQTIKEVKDLVDPKNFGPLVRRYLNSLGTLSKKQINTMVSDSHDYTDELTLQASKLAIQKLFPHKTKPNMRFRVNKKLAERIKRETKKGRRSTVSASKAKLKETKSKETFGGVVAGVGTARRKAQPKTTRNNVLSLRNMLNSILPSQVAMNMTEPALRFRTGRFANSVRVTNIIQRPRGGLHLDYTYMREPYETFEPGNQQGSTLRDPRRLIGGTIRQIMTKQAIERFTVKRV